MAMALASCFWRPMRKSCVLEEFRVNRLAVIQEDCVAEHYEEESQMSQKTGRVVCHQHTGGDLRKEMKKGY